MFKVVNEWLRGSREWTAPTNERRPPSLIQRPSSPPGASGAHWATINIALPDDGLERNDDAPGELRFA
jgi:hypothetical protein